MSEPIRHRRGGATAAAVVLLVAGLPAAIAQQAPPPPLVIAGIEVSPSAPGPDTLCQLRVRVENRGERPASALGFEVRIDGAVLPVYEDQLYYQKLEPGETSEIRLFNFWTSETGRPPPADGTLTVEVTLREASWLEVTSEGGKADEEGPVDAGNAEPVEVWTPAGAVGGLPVSASVVVEIQGAR